MKISKYIVPIALIAMFVLSACTVPITEEQGDSKVDSAVGQETAPVSAGGEIAAVNEFSGSRYGADLKCDQLKNEVSKKICESQINDVVGSMLENEIMSSYDVGRCKELPGDVGVNCTNYLTDTGVQGPISDEERAAFDKATNGSFPAPSEDGEIISPFPTFDSKECAGLKAKGFKEYCEKQIAQRLDQIKFDEIVQSGDVKRCGELSGDILDQCKLFLGEPVAVEAPPISEEVVQPVEEAPVEADEAAEVVASPETE